MKKLLLLVILAILIHCGFAQAETLRNSEVTFLLVQWEGTPFSDDFSMSVISVETPTIREPVWGITYRSGTYCENGHCTDKVVTIVTTRPVEIWYVKK